MPTRPEANTHLEAADVEELAAQAAAGSSTSFEALVRGLGPRLLRYLRRRLGDDHAAEDLLQETFLRAYRNLGRYDRTRSFTAWLFTIAANLTVSHWRAARPATALDGDPPAPPRRHPAEVLAEDEQAAEIWRRASRILPEPQFTALWLRYVEDMPIAQVAGAMGKSAGAVKVLLHRACRRLAGDADQRGADWPAALPAGRGAMPAGRILNECQQEA